MKGNCFLLLGNEKEQKQTFIDELVKYYPDAEYHSYHSFDTPVATLLDTLNNASLFAPSMVVRYDFVERVRSSNEIAMLRDYITDPSGNTLLLLTSDENSVNQSLSRIFAANRRKVFWPPYESSFPGWIKQRCSKYKVTITEDAIGILLERVEHDTAVLGEQLERLARICKGTITAKEVQDYIYHSKEENVFILFEALIVHDLRRSIEILENILLSHQGKSFVLLGGLRWQFQKLLQLNYLIEQGYTLSSACDELSIRSKRNLQVYQRAVTNFNSAAIEKLLIHIADCEIRLRSSDVHFEQVIMELLCYRTTCL